jgi:flagellar biosynthesis protein FliR
LFFTTDTHLALIGLIVDSYRQMPVGAPIADPQTLLGAVPAFVSHALVVGVQLALPIVIAMMVVNLAFGVLARAAPALNPISIGLPAALFVGLVLLVFIVPELLQPVSNLFLDAVNAASALLG